MKHCSKEKEKGEEEVNNPGEDETSEKALVVQVHPVEAFGHCLGHLQQANLYFGQQEDMIMGRDTVLECPAIREALCEC